MPRSAKALTCLALIRSLFTLIDKQQTWFGFYNNMAYEFNFGDSILLLLFGMFGLVG